MGRTAIKLTVIFLYVTVLGLACTVPYIYESPSLFYKTGLDKWLLRAGKIFGIMAAVMICFQIVYVSRKKWFENIFTPRQSLQYHKRSGLVILFLLMAHVLLILGADHFVFFPLESRYWPEFTGIGLFMVLAVFILASYWQRKSGISYRTWRLLHRIFAPVIMGVMTVHVLNVSRSFESGVPFWGFIIMLSASAFLYILTYTRN